MSLKRGTRRKSRTFRKNKSSSGKLRNKSNRVKNKSHTKRRLSGGKKKQRVSRKPTTNKQREARKLFKKRVESVQRHMKAGLNRKQAWKKVMNKSMFGNAIPTNIAGF